MSGKSKYSVGHEFANRKRLVECVGSDPKFRVKLWIWECMDCGMRHGPSSTPSITRPKKPACCYQAAKSGSANNNWRGYEQLSGVWLGQRKSDAYNRGLVWDVTPEYLWRLWLEQGGKCWYTGKQLELYKGVAGSTASLDRTDNTVGYLPGNVRWVHTTVNRMKTNLTEQEFIDCCLAVANFR